MRYIGRGLIYPSQRSYRWHYRERKNDSVSPQKKGEPHVEKWTNVFHSNKTSLNKPGNHATRGYTLNRERRNTESRRFPSGTLHPGNIYTGYSPSFSSSKNRQTVCQARHARRAAIFALGINGGKVGKPNYRPESQVDCSPRGG